MLRLIFISLILLFPLYSQGQTFYAENDSVSFSVQSITSKDSIDGFKIKIANKSSSDIYFANDTIFKEHVFINTIGNTLLIHCGGTFSQPYDRSIDNILVELVKIKSKDSFTKIVMLPRLSASNKKATTFEFSQMTKSFWLDYINSNRLPTVGWHYLEYKKYIQLKERVAVNVSHSE